MSIAEALVSIVNGQEQPGLYTMLPSPGVTWPDLHRWYCRRAVYHARSAANEITAGRRASQYRPYGNNHSVFSGRRFQNLSESLAATDAYSSRILAVLDRGLPKRRGTGTRRE